MIVIFKNTSITILDKGSKSIVKKVDYLRCDNKLINQFFFLEIWKMKQKENNYFFFQIKQRNGVIFVDTIRMFALEPRVLFTLNNASSTGFFGHKKALDFK